MTTQIRKLAVLRRPITLGVALAIGLGAALLGAGGGVALTATVFQREDVPLAVELRDGGPPTSFRAVLGSDEGSPSAEVAFDVWWQSRLLVAKDGRSWNRRRFILGAAHKEGGAHVDPKPPAWWRDLRDGTWIGAVKVETPTGEVALSDLAPAVMRQIAHELLTTLEAAGHA
jgi:hypothetical protein